MPVLRNVYFPIVGAGVRVGSKVILFKSELLIWDPLGASAAMRETYQQRRASQLRMSAVRQKRAFNI